MKTTELKKEFQQGKYTELLRDIYVDEEVLEYQKVRYIPEIRKTAGDRAVLRAMHWFEETDRVIDQVNALEQADFEEFKR